MQVKEYNFIGLLLAIVHLGVTQDLERTWNMVSYVDISTSTETTIEDPESYTITFTDSGTIYGKADCNTCTGNYTTENSEIKFDSISCTERGCLPGSQEDLLTSVLYSGGPYEIGSDSLAVLGRDLSFGAIFVVDESLGTSHEKKMNIDVLEVQRKGNTFQINFPPKWVGAEITLFNLGGVVMDRFVYNGEAVEIQSGFLNLFAISRVGDKTGVFHLVR